MRISLFMAAGISFASLASLDADEISFKDLGVQVPKSKPFLASVWVRAKEKSGEDALVQLNVGEKPGGKEKTGDPGYTKAKTSEWSRLSQWIPPAGEGCERIDVTVCTPNGVGLEIRDAKIAIVPDSLPPFDKGFIRVQGSALSNDKGRIIFRGVNLAAYSDDEKEDAGYMLGRCCEDDYKEIAGLGFNAVRLACWHKALVEPGGFDWLRLQISFARKYGLYIVLDMHAPPGGYQGPEYNGKFWHVEKGAKFRDELVKFWSDTAKSLKDEPAVAAYDLLNEPKPKKNTQWHEYAKLLISKVREQGDKHAIIVETAMLGENDWPELDDNLIIYDTHFYDPWEFVSQSEKKPFGKYNVEHNIWGEKVRLDKKWLESQLDEYLSWCKRKNVPMQVGEYGLGLHAQTPENGGLDWLTDSVSIFDGNGVSRFYWSWDIYDFAIHNGWFRRDPGIFCKEAAKIAASGTDLPINE